MDDVFFNANHSPIGSYASLTFGNKGARGGLDLEAGKPADEGLFIGLESDEQGVFLALPFYQDCQDERARYSISSVNPDYVYKVKITPFPDDLITRDFGVATDTWHAPRLTFRVFSHVLPLPDPETAVPEEMQRALAPAVLAEITVDNTGSRTSRRAFFGRRTEDSISSTRTFNCGVNDSISGIGNGTTTAIASGNTDVHTGQGFVLEEIIEPRRQGNLAFGLGSVAALVMTAPPQQLTTWRFAICFYRDGVVTTGIPARYAYCRWFSGIESVAEYALNNFDFYKQASEAADQAFQADHLSSYQEFMISHSVRSYYANTQCLESDDGLIWVVNEGNYRLINTLDLCVDHVFHELRMNPWTVRNVLDLYLERYSYRDSVHFPGDVSEYPGGLCFTHDMGRANNFSPSGRSAYELAGFAGCFSYMSCEQLVNWTLCAAVYYARTHDAEWLSLRADTFAECLTSLMNRDHPVPDLRDGVMDLDSSRALGGSEITTYDSLDTSLGQARRSLYLAVKTWAAYVVLEDMLTTLDRQDMAVLAGTQAELSAETITGSMTQDGYMPALLDSGSISKTIPAVEGLVFPYFAGCTKACDLGGQYGRMLEALRGHLSTVLNRDSCLFEDGGWRLSSSSDNSWLSKIYLCQFIARRILGMKRDRDVEAADRTHARWLLHPETRYWCWSDQMISGRAWGSMYYPRGVTSVLWLHEGPDIG